MKTTTRASLVLILVGLMVLLSFPSLMGADGGANVVRGDECTISLYEVGGDEVTTTDTQSVETPSGNVSLVCRAELPDGVDPPRRAVRTSGELCQTPLGPTTDTDKIITPKGIVRLTCRVNGRARPPATGWATGDSVDGYGVILHTTDGGETWVRQGQVGEIPDVDLHRVSAIDAQNAWVAGDQGTILRTRNGGRTWELQEIPDEVSEVALAGIYAIDRKTAWTAGTLVSDDSQQGIILHTTDGGHTWTQQGQGTVPTNTKLEGVYASDADHAWTVGSVYDHVHKTEKKIMLRTANGGNTWEVVPWPWPGGAGHGIDIHGVDANTLWAVGTGMVVHSADGGLTWDDRFPDEWFPRFWDVNGVFAVDRKTVWVVIDAGGIARSDDGGLTWTRQDSPSGATGDYTMRVCAVDKQTAWAVTDGYGDEDPGHVLHTSDGGWTKTSWTKQTTPVHPHSFGGVSFVR